MDRAQVLQALKESAAEVLQVDASGITEDTHFKDDLEADSLDFVELVMAMEERFDVTVPEEQLEGVRTVGQAVDVIVERIAASV